MRGYECAEIDYSHHKRKMENPEMEDGFVKILSGRKPIAIDVDFITGITLGKVFFYLSERKIKLEGAYMGLSDWGQLSNNEPLFGREGGFWEQEDWA